ncbi:hypothetical protein NQD34_011655 [Periophthalmus magnuspinnatus]|nr:hypothetical protein NQD34_011655 [Periophthalmus magnuspinnatus]
MILLGDPAEQMIKEQDQKMSMDGKKDANDDDQVTMAVITTPSDINITLEGETVMTNLQSAIKGFVMSFGLIYALNMRYLKKCDRTCEFVQKVLLGLKSKRISTPTQRLAA